MKNPPVYCVNGIIVTTEMAGDSLAALGKRVETDDFLKALSLVYMAFMNFCTMTMPSELPDKAIKTWALDTETKAFIALLSIHSGETISTVKAVLAAAKEQARSFPF